MSKEAEILKQIIGNSEGMHLCTVDAVNGLMCDVTPISGEAPLKNVRLNSDTENDAGICITPKQGSVVLVVEVTKLDAYVAMFSAIESISVKVDGDIVFNGGTNNGLVILNRLKSNLNAIDNYLATLKSAIANGINAVGIGTAANGPAGAAAFNAVMASSSIVYEDMENTKIKH